MLIFSSKAFNIGPLIPIVKSPLNEKTVDPYLQLVEDSKLQAVNAAPEHCSRVYGSQEDDNNALKSLQVVELTESQSREFIVSQIMNSLSDLSDSEISMVRNQLLSNFWPDDICPLGAQFMETSRQLPFESKKENTQEVTPATILVDDVFPEAFETVPDSLKLTSNSSNLLSVDQLLEMVPDTTLQVGRFSVSTTSDVPFKEMAGHCKALVMGKHQKMSVLTGAQQKHDILLGGSSTDQNGDKMSSCFNVDQPGKSDNPFLDEKLNLDVQNQFGGNNMILYQSQCLRLPASSPYDHFLKAAGC